MTIAMQAHPWEKSESRDLFAFQEACFHLVRNKVYPGINFSQRIMDECAAQYESMDDMCKIKAGDQVRVREGILKGKTGIVGEQASQFFLTYWIEMVEADTWHTQQPITNLELVRTAEERKYRMEFQALLHSFEYNLQVCKCDNPHHCTSCQSAEEMIVKIKDALKELR